MNSQVINNDPQLFFQRSAQEKEHSLEVELPFLQKTLSNFKILPILFGNNSRDDWPVLARALVENIRGKNVLLLASSDLSHYPALKDAERIDAITIQAILSGDAAIGFFGQRRGNLLNRTEREKLLDLARQSVESFVKTGRAPELKNDLPALNQKIGAFVTLKESGQLRGYFANVVKMTVGKKVSCEEIECVYRGSPHHEFMLKW